VIRAAHVVLFYAFDVAEAIDFNRLRALLGQAASPAKLAPKPPTPPYVQYQQPPLTFDGALIEVPEIAGRPVRIRVYDYGAISFALRQPFSGSWADLIDVAQRVTDNAQLEAEISTCAGHAVDRLRAALEKPRAEWLVEDYVVFSVTGLNEPLTADDLIDRHGAEIARLLRSESGSLSNQEIDHVLRNRLSYLADDVVIPTWNSALVYDTDAGAEAAEDILEFANSQLLQFRYYDQLLDSELARLYDELQRERRPMVFGARRHTRAAQHVHALLIDIRELVDRTENALKFVGDIYAARMFWLIAARLGLDRWKAHVSDKLQTLDSIYHFTVEQSNTARGELMELTVIGILVLELVLFFLGIMK
jgi:hypothetical protein